MYGIETVLRFVGIEELGTCPGAQVQGELEICREVGGCNDLGGVLDGTPVQAEIFNSRSSGDGWFIWWDNEIGMLLLGDTPGTGNAVLTGGLIATPPDGPHGGTFYFIGGGMFVKQEDGSTLITIQGLSRLGSCSNVKGPEALDVCLHF